jgi:hypothetical protein
MVGSVVIYSFPLNKHAFPPAAAARTSFRAQLPFQWELREPQEHEHQRTFNDPLEKPRGTVKKTETMFKG